MSEAVAVVEVLTAGRDELAFHINEYLTNATNPAQAAIAAERDSEFVQALTQAIDLLTPAPKDTK